MFGLVRLAVFTVLAFIAGMVYQTLAHSTACEAQGGRVTKGICVGNG